MMIVCRSEKEQKTPKNHERETKLKEKALEQNQVY
jgi:hypothetical protein